jgi:hypothetical protein
LQTRWEWLEMIPTLEQLAKRISTDLFNSRKLAKSSPENPVTSQTMCTAYMALYKWEITDRETRAATKFLIEQKVPIGTTLEGCYWVLNSKEWEPTINMLMPKFLSIKSKIDLIKEMQSEMAAKEQGQLDIPLFKTLNNKLELERVK